MAKHTRNVCLVFVKCAARRLRYMTPLQGSAAYAPEKEALVWKIRNFPGGKEFLLRAKFGLPSVAAEDEQTGRMPPIRVNYEVSALS